MYYYKTNIPQTCCMSISLIKHGMQTKDGQMLGHLMMMLQLQTLYSVEWYEKMAISGKKVRIWKVVVMTYFKIVSQH